MQGAVESGLTENETRSRSKHIRNETDIVLNTLGTRPNRLLEPARESGEPCNERGQRFRGGEASGRNRRRGVGQGRWAAALYLSATTPARACWTAMLLGLIFLPPNCEGSRENTGSE